MRLSLIRRKITKVPTRDVVPASSLQYRPRYVPARKMTLSSSFDVVTDKNRFLSLELVLQKFSGYIGRRQYKMQSDLTQHLDKLKAMGIDWHELKSLSSEELRLLFRDVLALPPNEHAVLLSAVEAKLCGVLRQSSTRHSTNLCMSPGVQAYGWRCGKHGHVNDVYFEGKQKANPAALQLAHRSLVRRTERDGVAVDVRSQPDFSIVGRGEPNTHPRVWAAPQNAAFNVSVIGYEFRVHPSDPRAVPQIEEAASEWELHAAVVKQVVWEMLELHAVEREPQALGMQPGEMGSRDEPPSYSRAFAVQDGDRDDLRPGEGPLVEQAMLTPDGTEAPWFRTPLSQHYENGVLAALPFAPTIVIRSTFRPVTRLAGDDVVKHLMQPVVDLTCFVHPSACFWWNPEDEAKCVRQILEYAKRLPYSLPFNLYLRVDPTKVDRLEPDLAAERERLLQEKEPFFDLHRFRRSPLHAYAREGDTRMM